MGSETEFNMSAALDMLYLCGCVLKNEKPKPERLAALDLAALYAICKFHSLTALVSEALEGAGYAFPDEAKPYLRAFTQAKEMSVRKNTLLDIERSALFDFMEQNGIWHVPLKGIILKDMYPKMGLRQMSDNDILFDGSRREAVRDWFAERGYDTKHYNLGIDDDYKKEPIYNFEMHTELFGSYHDRVLVEYYRTVRERLVPIDTAGHELSFTDEDYYVYFTAHAFKHYDGGGIGIRSLLDLYVYLSEKQASMDFEYIYAELDKLGIGEFEKDNRALADEIFADIHNFDPDRLTQKARDMLLYYLSSGTYGILSHNVENKIASSSKLKYLLSRIFPNAEFMGRYNPIFKKHKWLIPVGWVMRWFDRLKKNSGKVKSELGMILKHKRKK